MSKFFNDKRVGFSFAEWNADEGANGQIFGTRIGQNVTVGAKNSVWDHLVKHSIIITREANLAKIKRWPFFKKQKLGVVKMTFFGIIEIRIVR